ncbi:hypothetical protein XENTR_v10019807 [Xenopus tropicalis]|nr:hypothetical protein XENTR_v10019807 [Xenopus tropicalis]
MSGGTGDLLPPIPSEILCFTNTFTTKMPETRHEIWIHCNKPAHFNGFPIKKTLQYGPIDFNAFFGVSADLGGFCANFQTDSISRCCSELISP